MIINYKESISLLTMGFYIKNDEENEKFNEIVGRDLSEKITDLEEEEYYMILKRETADSLIEGVKQSSETYKDVGDLISKYRNSSNENSDVAVPISLNDLEILSKLTISRREGNLDNEKIITRLNIDMAEIEQMSSEIQKTIAINIPDDKLKTVLKMIKHNELIEVDSEFFKKAVSSINSNKNTLKR